MRRETQCVQVGSGPMPTVAGANTPVFTSTAYEYLDCSGPLYQRFFNTPNQAAVVKKLCALEEAEDGLILASGMAAISTALLSVLRTGDHAVVQDDLYGGTHSFVSDSFPRLGIRFTWAKGTPEDLLAAVQEDTRAIYMETPANPLLGVVDLAAVAAVARAKGITTLVDNTFATPICQQPLKLGIDLVVHSATKYMGGHSDLQAGAIVGPEDLVAQARLTATGFGGSLNATECYMLERSLKTLSLRVERQCENALKLARRLEAHPLVRRVYYPGLESHPSFDVARRQMNPYGAVLSFETAPEVGTAHEYMRRLHMIRPTISLGGVESTICDPASTSHHKMKPAERARVGIGDNLLRLSVGIEHVDDLMEDLEAALTARS